MNEIKTDVRISSTEIAKRTNKQHKHVIRDIRNTFLALEADETPYLGTYKDAKGQDRPCYHLDRKYAMILGTGYDISQREQIVDFFISNHQRLDAPATTTELSPANAAIIASLRHHETSILRVDAAEKKIALLENKVETLETLAGNGGSTGYYTIKAFCNNSKVRLAKGEAISAGSKCKKLSLARGLKVDRVADANYDKVNSYNVDIIIEVLTSMGRLNKGEVK